MNEDQITRLIHKHFKIWNETDSLKRAAQIAEIYTEDIEFIDPFSQLEGRENLNHFIEELLDKNKGFVFSQSKEIQCHHNIASAFWHFGPASKPDTIKGQDIFVVQEGCIQKLYAFVG